VDDVATAERDGLRPAAALRRAQVEMAAQQRWASSYYWAAFQIHGDWR
jgi:CHAT domain-containing protein